MISLRAGLWRARDGDGRQDGEEHLDSLDVLERGDELVFWAGGVSDMFDQLKEERHGLVQTVDASAQQKVGRHVQRHAVKQVHHVHRLPRGRQLADEGRGPLVKDLEVLHPVLDEHGPDQGPAVRPLLPVGGED